MRQKLIDEILALHDKLRDKRDENEQWDVITEYDCVYSDLLDYEDNQFYTFHHRFRTRNTRFSDREDKAFYSRIHIHRKTK